MSHTLSENRRRIDGPVVVDDNWRVPPLEFFTHAPQPAPDTPIWRFRRLKFFRDIIQTREFHFTRTDRFPQDEQEGIPPEEYIAAVLRLDRFDPRNRATIDSHVGMLAQDRESFFIHCWYHFDEERAGTWKTYGLDGVALCTRYDLLCAVATSFEPRPHVGLVQYGTSHLNGHYNVQQFITTKRDQFRDDREFRLGLWRIDPLASNNRHFDNDNRAHQRPILEWIDERRQPMFLRQKVDLQALVTEIVVSPYAADSTRADVEQMVGRAGLHISVRDSCLRRFKTFLP